MYDHRAHCFCSFIKTNHSSTPVTLQAFDQHLNMVLGEVEEVVTSREVDEETEEEIVKVSSLHFHSSIRSKFTFFI